MKFSFLVIASLTVCHKGNALLQTQPHLRKNAEKLIYNIYFLAAAH